MNRVHNIFLRPVTPIYFGRPGALPAGEAHVGMSWFPPPISAFQGMIRTKLLQQAGVFSPKRKVEDLIGTTDGLPKGWSLKGPFPAQYRENRRLQIWFPAPSFLFPPLQEDALEPVIASPMTEDMELQLLMDKGTSIDKKDRLMISGAPGQAGTKPLDGWISSRNLYWAVCGSKGNVSWEPEGCSRGLPPFVKWETRPGLEREKEKKKGQAGVKITGRAKEGMLYFLNCLRFSHSSVLVGWLEAALSPPLSPEALERGPILAGKKGGVAAFEQSEGTDRWWKLLGAGEHLVECVIPDPSLVWIILLSPGRWRSLKELKEMLSFEGKVEVYVRSILSKAPVFLGGFSMVERRPRPALSWYPPGTSILIELRGKTEKDMRKYLMELNNTSILADQQYRPFGYGHALVTSPINSGGNDG